MMKIVTYRPYLKSARAALVAKMKARGEGQGQAKAKGK